MRGILFVAALVATGAIANADPGATIRGRIGEREAGTPLPGANVVLVGTTVGTASDAGGRFTMKGIPPGTYLVRASFIGYQSQTHEVTVAEGDSVELIFVLAPGIIAGQPITVTATRGRERETPATFSMLRQQEIRDRYTTQDIPVLLSELPSSTSYSESGNGIGYTHLNIRGFDSRRVAVMINGIPQNDPEDHNVYWLDFPDLASSLEDIQVQRGGGSAFYGPPAIGGSVNLVTANFARERSVQVSAGFGSFATRKYAAAFSSGLIEDRYALHARLSAITSDGYRDRAWVDFTSYFLGAVRYDEQMTTQLNIYGGPIADGLAYFGIPKADVKNREKRRANPILRPEEMENFSQPHAELFHEWRLTPSLTLNNTAFLVLGEGFFDYDGSWAPYSYYRLTPENGFPVDGDPDTMAIPGALIRAQVENRQYGWLPRVTVRHDGGELTVGAELRIHRSEHWGRLQYFSQLPVEVPYDYRYYQYRGAKDIASVYASEIASPVANLTLMLNMQYAYQRYRFYDEKYVGTEFTVPYHFLNPRVGVNYNLDERWNTYLSVAYTSREPRLKNLYDAAEASTPPSWGAVVPQFPVNEAGSYDFSQPLVKPEALFNVELGSGFSQEYFRMSLNLYWMEFRDEIVKSGQVDRFGQPVTGNADRTRHIGVECVVWGLLTPWLEASGNVTLSRNRFIRHTDYSTGGSRPLDGNPIAGFPDLLANARVTVRHASVAASLSARYVGKQYTDNFRNEENTVDPFVVCDAWASVTFDRLVDGPTVALKLQVTNVFDELYAAFGEGDQFFVGAERNAFLTISLEM